jgi:hypothetical protein
MMMFLIAAAMATDTPAPATPPPPRLDDARSVVERQLASPPRTGAAAGLDSDEADMIYRRYIASIGEPLEPTRDDRPR